MQIQKTERTLRQLTSTFRPNPEFVAVRPYHHWKFPAGKLSFPRKDKLGAHSVLHIYSLLKQVNTPQRETKRLFETF